MNIRTKETSKLSDAIEGKSLSVVEDIKVIKTNEVNKEDEEFSFLVDYSQTLPEMIKAGNYDWINGDITKKRFPLPIELSGQKVTVRAKLFYFDHYIGSERVIDKIKKADPQCRMANVAELLAFAEAYPELQEKFPIIALESRWRVTRSSCRVVAIDFDTHGRELGMSWFEGIWQPYCRFLAICK